VQIFTSFQLHSFDLELALVGLLLDVFVYSIVFGRPFVKRFALCYRTVVLSVLSVCNVGVYCGQTVGRIRMKLGKQVGFGTGHTALDGDPAPLLQRGTAPRFSAHICCGQMAAWIKMPLGMEVGLGPEDVVLDGVAVPP